MPGATNIGFLAYRPIIRLLKKHTSIVAVSTPLNGKPAWLNIDGFTTIIYMVARNELIPAKISVLKKWFLVNKDGSGLIKYSYQNYKINDVNSYEFSKEVKKHKENL
jgi:hypothetical protein